MRVSEPSLAHRYQFSGSHADFTHEEVSDFLLHLGAVCTGFWSLYLQGSQGFGCEDDADVFPLLFCHLPTFCSDEVLTERT